MTDEIRYVEPGQEFDDDDYSGVGRVPKWRKPSTPFQMAVLSAAQRKYWPDKAIRHEFIMIEKAMQPMTEVFQPEMPTEWVRSCVKWFRNKNKRGYVPLKGLATLINDEERKSDFVRKNRGTITEQIQIDDDDPYG